MALDLFHPAVRNWFAGAFAAPSPAQEKAWAEIKAGRDTLISAPTGSGKTLAAFLAVIDDLLVRALDAGLPDQTQVLYVSPLKALSNDIHRNLEQPLAGIRRELAALLVDDLAVRADVRTGDTPQHERARMRRRPPHILVTTPESLYILLTSESGRAMLGNVREIVADGRGTVQQVVVQQGDITRALPAGMFSASGNALVAGQAQGNAETGGPERATAPGAEAE